MSPIRPISPIPCVDLWLPIIGTGGADDPFRPDAPRGLHWAAHGHAVDLDPQSPRHGKPVFSVICITVAEADAGRITNAVAAENVPLEARALVALCRSDVSDRADLSDLPGWAALPVAARRRLLLHAVRRGMAQAHAQRVVSDMASSRPSDGSDRSDEPDVSDLSDDILRAAADHARCCGCGPTPAAAPAVPLADGLPSCRYRSPGLAADAWLCGRTADPAKATGEICRACGDRAAV